MAARRAYAGTIPALTPGLKVGGDFVVDLSGSPEFVQNRLAMFEELYAEQQSKVVIGDEIKITLPDGTVKLGVANQTSPADIAADIRVKGVIVAKVAFSDPAFVTGCGKNLEAEDDDEEIIDPKAEDDKLFVVWDLQRPLPGDCRLRLLKFDDKEAKHVLWHSAAHLLGLSVECCFGAKVTIGPALQCGFYYDFFLGNNTISESDYDKIVEKAVSVTKTDAPFQRLEVTKDEALVLFEENPFKVSLISAKIPDGGKTTVYRCGSFVDLCMGPHIPNLNVIKAFAVEKHSATYWLGDAKGDSLQRVYGIAFPEAKMLKEHKKRVEEAKKRDHRNLGTQLGLFFFEHNYAPGCAFWTPTGMRLYSKLCNFIRDEYRFRGFQEVNTPNAFASDIFKASGHWQNYQENMFIMDVEGKPWALKPMNCPAHCCIFKNLNLSYKQLPIRMADFGVLHRNEFSGSLSGLTRVRRFQQDDAHIFCMLEQVKPEVAAALDFVFFCYKIFGFRFELYLSTRPKKALGTVALWDYAEAQLAEALDECGLPWKINKGDGAFYGPKIDIKLFDAMERTHQCGTIQLDFQLPLRFDLQFRDADVKEGEVYTAPINANSTTDGNLKQVDGSLESELKPGMGRPVMIHRAVLGSVERMSAIMIEHYAGKFPFWMSPRQAIVLPIGEKQLKYAQYVGDQLKKQGFDVEVDTSNNTINKKIRGAQIMQWNYILVVGADEQTNRTVMVRNRDPTIAQQSMDIPALLELFKKERDVACRHNLQIEEFVDEE